jgi:hypothetical protein
MTTEQSMMTHLQRTMDGIFAPAVAAAHNITPRRRPELLAEIELDAIELDAKESGKHFCFFTLHVYGYWHRSLDDITITDVNIGDQNIIGDLDGQTMEKIEKWIRENTCPPSSTCSSSS